MRLETYKQLLRIVTVCMGFVVAVGVALNNLFVPLVGIVLGMLFLYLARRGVAEVDYDERTSLINQKSAQKTLSITIVTISFLGLGLVLLSRQGFFDYETEGFWLSFIGLGIMALKSFFDWYYKNRLSG